MVVQAVVNEKVSSMIALINRETTWNPEKRSPDPISLSPATHGFRAL
tara:strand:- start:10439 stop:10579 length:141 start_codon:yes stop_codon:yes gene_type:complete